MTTKLEKEFFIKFNIPKLKPCEYGFGCGHAIPCSECKRKEVYPEINQDVVLKLMKILLHRRGSLEIIPPHGKYLMSTGTELYSKAGDNITDATLQNCIKHYDDINIQKDIKKLFKKKGIL
jgi:hypothetical protein